MSWSFQSVGSRAAVRAELLKSYVPDGLKATLISVIDDATARANAGETQIRSHVRVETHGHLDSSYGGSVNKLEIQFLNLAAEPAPESKPEVAPPAPDQAAQ